MTTRHDSDSGARPDRSALIVRLPDGRVLRFVDSFHIGRDSDCDVAIQDAQVSRRHAVVSFAQEAWTIRDLQSRNGLFVEGQRVESATIGDGLTVELGSEGPYLQIEAERPVAPASHDPEPPSDEDDSLDGYTERYFGAGSGQRAMGGRTVMIRAAFEKIQQKQKRRHRGTIALVALIAVGVGLFAYYERQQRLEERQQRLVIEAKAEDVFYRMKEFELNVARLDATLAKSGKPQGGPQVTVYVDQQRTMETSYNQYAASLYDRKLTATERLILRVTRDFGECEIAVPPGYIKEVQRYIGKWKSTGRFARAVKLAEERGYTRRIVAELTAQGLRPEYFYLAMQESDFLPNRVGSPTKWGLAKGMWQFIPETGGRFGLAIGPRAASASGEDPLDERLDWEKATVAAARYIKDIYTTDAQASGLLVMASYNWGEHRVIDRLRKMPANPKERNFWQLLAKYPIPPQTYEYVFHIVAAAVIGQNPRLFGFDLDNPLAFVNQQ